MASIKFLLQSKKDLAPIYLRLSVSRGNVFKRRTGLFISFKDWSKETGFPKQKNSEGRDLKNLLQKLEIYISESFNKDYSKGIDINGFWLEENIKKHFNQEDKQKSLEGILDYIDYYVSLADIKPNAKGGVGLSKSRINDFKLLGNLITKYQGKRKLLIKDIDVNFKNKFVKWGIETEGYAKGYIGRTLGTLKTLCLDAEINGVEVSPQLKNVTGFKTKNEYVIYLTPLELEQIEKVNLSHDYLNNARKWLLLGCNLGQRAGDLLKLTEENFVTRNGLDVIELRQQKGHKLITIPVLTKTKEVLKNGFPRKISTQKFNDYIKEVCKIAGLEEPTEGKKLNKETKRKELGVYPKHELISTHICRRSFATNQYGVLPTNLIMQITGHSTEKVFLNYIGKSGIDYAQQIADFYAKQMQKENQTPEQLTDNLKAI